MSLRCLQFYQDNRRHRVWGACIEPNTVVLKLIDLAVCLGYIKLKYIHKLVPSAHTVRWGFIKQTIPLPIPTVEWSDDTIFVTESGVYAMLSRCKKPAAKWMTKTYAEVIAPFFRWKYDYMYVATCPSYSRRNLYKIGRTQNPPECLHAMNFSRFDVDDYMRYSFCIPIDPTLAALVQLEIRKIYKKFRVCDKDFYFLNEHDLQTIKRYIVSCSLPVRFLFNYKKINM
nr:BRO-H [Darna trima granulovirus]